MRQPIFATKENPVVRICDDKLKEWETQQMAQRCKIIKFKHQYLSDKANYDLIACNSCLAKLILGAP